MWRFLILLAVASLTRATDPARPLPNDAYIWQRVWTPAVTDAVRESAGLVHAWRVLGAEIDARGIDARSKVFTSAPDWAALAATNRRSILVIRIDGRIAADSPAGDAVAAVLDRAGAAGAVIAGVEIDHDCATARLPDYIRFLAALRARLPAGLPLSITALPTWLGSPSMADLVSATDEIVLQVHAVRSPDQGLFDPDLAVRWAARLGRITSKPFRVALPAYGARVDWDAEGRFVAIESEAPLLAGSTRSTELVATPARVQDAPNRLSRAPPDALAGIVWFRLPTAVDARSWSLAGWRAVLSGRDAHAELTATTRAATVPGLAWIELANTGAIDAELPGTIRLAPACEVADGANGYGIERDRAGLALRRMRNGLLAAGQRRLVGWTRCPAEESDHRRLDVEP